MARPKKPESEKRVKVSIRLEPELLAFIEATVEQHNRLAEVWGHKQTTRNEVIERMLNQTREMQS